VQESHIEQLNLKSLLKHANLAVVIHKMDTSIVYANPVALRLLGSSYDKVIGADAFDHQWYFVDEFGHKLPADQYPVNKVISCGEALANEIIGRYDLETQEVVWYLVNAYLEHGGSDDRKQGFVDVTFNDISDQRNLFSYRDIIQNTQDIIIVTDAEDVQGPLGPKIVFVNKAFEELTGYKASEVIGETPRILQGRGTDKCALENIRAALEKQEPVREQLLNYSKTGHPYWLDMNIFPLRNKFGKVTHFAAIERDVTDSTFKAHQLEKSNADLKALKETLEHVVATQTKKLRIANQRLEKLAYYDDLTGIANRRSFKDQASKLVSLSLRYNHFFMTGLLDIDRFKRINDSCGHDVGDKVLQQVAGVLKSRFRQEDAFGRIGGEEFAFALVVESEQAAALFCERLRAELEISDLQIEGCNLPLSVSIGYSVSKLEETYTLGDALKQADQALYNAKNSGRNCVRSFQDGD
jgi:diguanylate cyclase (GGDEF)-like protein/PAS domain S-box-containing protein